VITAGPAIGVSPRRLGIHPASALAAEPFAAHHTRARGCPWSRPPARADQIHAASVLRVLWMQCIQSAQRTMLASTTAPNGDHTDQRSPLRGLWEAHAGSGAVADTAYTTLRQAILSGLLGPGHRLSEAQLAREFGVSRTPIREAIFRLEAERFAIRQMHRGLVVRTIPEEQVLEVFTVVGRTRSACRPHRRGASHGAPRACRVLSDQCLIVYEVLWVDQ
jgi:biotin operon repressor